MNQALKRRFRCWHVNALGICACVVLTLVFHIAGVLPVLRQHAHNVKQHVELESQKTKAAKLAAAADNLAHRLRKVGQALDDAPVQLQTTRQLNQRLAHLASLAAECGLAIDQTHSDRPYSSTWYQTVPIRLVGEGTYPTCALFLSKLRQTFPDTGVSALELAGEPHSNSAASQFTFDLVWYTQPALSSAQN